MSEYSDPEDFHSDQDQEEAVDDHETIKKLRQDKKSLRKKLRQLIKKYDSKTGGYDEKINELTRKLIDQQQQCEHITAELAAARELHLEEKQQIKDGYENRLNQLKAAVDSRPAESQGMIKRLEATVAHLQEQLLNNEINNPLVEKEREMRENNAVLRQSLQKAEESLMQRDQDFQNFVEACRIEREQLSQQLKRDYEKELAAAISERNAAMDRLVTIKDQFDKKIAALERQNNDRDVQTQAEIQLIRYDAEKQVKAHQDQFKQRYEELRNGLTAKLQGQDMLYKKQLEELKAEYEKRLNHYNAENTHKLDHVINNLKREIEDQRKIVTDQRQELDNYHQNLKKELDKKEAEMKEKFSTVLQLEQSKMLQIISDREREMQNQRLKYEKSQGEVQDINRHIGEQLQQAKETIHRLQEQNQAINNQFVQTMKKHKEAAEMEIATKSAAFTQLERQYKSLRDESVERLNMLTRRCQTSEDELRAVTEKYIKVKEKLESQDQLLVDQKSEMEQYRDITAKCLEKTKQAVGMREEAERMVAALNTELQNSRTMQEALKNKASELSTSIKNLNEQINLLQADAERRDRQIKTLQNELDISNRLTQGLREESTVIRNTCQEEFKQKLAAQQNESQRQINQLVDKVNTYEKQIQTISENQVQLLNSLAVVTSERDRLQKEIVLANEKMREAEKTVNEGRIIKEHLNKLKEDFVNNLNAMTQDRDQKANELHNAKEKLREYEQKDAQIMQLSHQLQQLQASHRQQLDKLLAESAHDREELVSLREKQNQMIERTRENEALKKTLLEQQDNHMAAIKKKDDENRRQIAKLIATVNEKDGQLSQYDGKIQKMKVEFLRQLTEARKMPADDLARMESLEKDKYELAVQLTAAEKKLQQLQHDYTEASTLIKVKQDALEKKEVELKLKEKELQNIQPKLLDPSLKKSRDEALDQVRHVRMELAKVRDEATALSQKLHISEKIVEDLKKEREMITQSQADLKESFLTNLNQQQHRYEKELSTRDERIKQLEQLLTDRLLSK